MKRTKKNEEKWYLFVDGKSSKVTNTLTEISQLNGVIIEITASQAASILGLILQSKKDQLNWRGSAMSSRLVCLVVGSTTIFLKRKLRKSIDFFCDM